jgi:hypothetical protein
VTRIGDSTSYSEFPPVFLADWKKREKDVLSPISTYEGGRYAHIDATALLGLILKLPENF